VRRSWYIPSMDAEKDLWSDVLLRAMLDLKGVDAGRRKEHIRRHKYDARAWFESSVVSVGSFIWVFTISRSIRMPSGVLCLHDHRWPLCPFRLCPMLTT